MTNIFIDGSAGTTGLRIFDRLSLRNDIRLIVLPEKSRKDPEARRDALNMADIAFLCLPDDAARQAVSLIDNPHTVVIDTSTAHRTAEGWSYGFPELEGAEKIASSKRIANPGCHASGFVALIKPLIDSKAIKPDTALSCFSLTGYSGGGKKMIAEYEAEEKDVLLSAPRQYGLSQQHKHLNEMVKVTGLEVSPAFCPIVSSFYSGMEVTVPIFKKDLNCSVEELKEIYKSVYTGNLVKYTDGANENGFMSAAAFSGRDDMQITVKGNEERLLLIARFDNLGKGASGAAIQNMNIVMGADETSGLVY